MSKMLYLQFVFFFQIVFGSQGNKFCRKRRLFGHVPESELVMSFTSIMDLGLTLDLHKRVKYSTNRIIRTF